MQFIVSQILGGIALILVCISYFCNKKNFLIFQILSNIFYGSAFVVSLSLVAGINTFISIVRILAFYFYEKKDKQSPWYLILIFAVFYITIGIIFFKTPWDIATTISPILFTIAMRLKKMITINFFVLVPNLILFLFCIFNKFYTSAILDGIELIVIVVAITTYFITKHRNRKNLLKLI